MVLPNRIHHITKSKKRNWITTRDLFFLLFGWLSGMVVTVLFIDQSTIWKGIVGYFRKYPIYFKRVPAARLTIPNITFRDKEDKPPSGWDGRWPPPHAGGLKESEVYRWAADEIRKTGISWQDAWEMVEGEFPEYRSKDDLIKKAQRNAFSKGVQRALKKPDTTPKR